MFRTSLRSSQDCCEVQKFIMRFTNQFVSYAFDWLLLLHGPIRGTLFTNWLVNSNMSFRTSQRTCELRNEVRNICGQSFVKSTVKSSPGWGIFHSQLAQGPCISLQVVSRHPGIYTIITNQIKCPGVFPGGGMVTPGIDSCIITK